MQQTGTVKELFDNKARVQVKRQTACGENCANCGGCSGLYREIIAENSIGARAGDTVLVEMRDKNVLKAAFLAYIVPLFALIFGYAAANKFMKNELYSIATAFLLMFIVYIIIHFVDKKINYLHNIVEIL